MVDTEAPRRRQGKASCLSRWLLAPAGALSGVRWRYQTGPGVPVLTRAFLVDPLKEGPSWAQLEEVKVWATCPHAPLPSFSYFL